MFGKGGARVVHRDLEQAHLTVALEGVPQSDPSLFSPAGLQQHAGRRDVVAAVSGSARTARALLFDLHVSRAAFSDTGFFGLYTGTDPADAPEMMDVIVDVMTDAVETLTEAEISRAKAQMKAGLC